MLRRSTLLFLALVAPLSAFAQPAGYRALEELGDPSQEARHIQVFEAIAGDSVKATLSRWSQQAGWAPPVSQLPGDADFALARTVRFEGDFKTASRSFISALPAELGLTVRFEEAKRRAVLQLKPPALR